MTDGVKLRLFITSDCVGGVWQYSCGLAREMARAGHEVTLATFGPAPGAAQRQLLAGESGVDLLETRLPLDWLCEAPDQVKAAGRELARLAASRGADVVHCNAPALLADASFAQPVVAMAHGCIASWWAATRHGPLDPQLAWHRDLMRRGLLAADRVVAPSRSFAAQLQRIYALPAMPQVVHNALGRGHGRRPVHACDPLDAALTVGRLWDDAKNARVLEQAAGLLGHPLLAAGAVCRPGGEPLSFAHLQTLGELAEDELAALLARRPVFVSAALFEPFGLAVLEAAAAGCPLVLSDIDTFRELWDGAALFVDPADAAGFAGAIERVLGDEALRRRLGEAAAARARKFTAGAQARRMAAIYADLAAPGRQAA